MIISYPSQNLSKIITKYPIKKKNKSKLSKNNKKKSQKFYILLPIVNGTQIYQKLRKINPNNRNQLQLLIQKSPNLNKNLLNLLTLLQSRNLSHKHRISQIRIASRNKRIILSRSNQRIKNKFNPKLRLLSLRKINRRGKKRSKTTKISQISQISKRSKTTKISQIRKRSQIRKKSKKSPVNKILNAVRINQCPKASNNLSNSKKRHSKLSLSQCRRMNLNPNLPWNLSSRKRQKPSKRSRLTSLKQSRLSSHRNKIHLLKSHSKFSRLKNLTKKTKKTSHLLLRRQKTRRKKRVKFNSQISKLISKINNFLDLQI